jgi:hypothetical protein
MGGIASKRTGYHTEFGRARQMSDKRMAERRNPQKDSEAGQHGAASIIRRCRAAPREKTKGE